MRPELLADAVFEQLHPAARAAHRVRSGHDRARHSEPLATGCERAFAVARPPDAAASGTKAST